jgi:hypothetical protein
MYTDPITKSNPPLAPIGKYEFADDMLKQGMFQWRYSGGMPDREHQRGCPGCDPNARNDPQFASWFEVETKWRERGEPPTCPKERQAWWRAKYSKCSWWNEARDGEAHYAPR